MKLITCVLLLCAVLAVKGDNLRITDVVFHLFTRNNPAASQPLIASVASIISSSFDITKRTVFTIHDYGESVAGNFNAFLAPAELQGGDVNLIAVDWSMGSALYTVGLVNAPAAGEAVATFINILTTNFGYDSSLIRIVGVGLGAHVAGIAARKSTKSIPHIIALDPSLHGWTHNDQILSADDAEVVEVLHTSGGIIGYDYPLGDVDFYANGGSYQIGCGNDASCAHIYAYAYYAESITSEVLSGQSFIGTACDSYEEAVTMNCNGARDVTFGGRSTKSGVSGIYTFGTNVAPPFARG